MTYPNFPDGNRMLVKTSTSTLPPKHSLDVWFGEFLVSLTTRGIFSSSLSEYLEYVWNNYWSSEPRSFVFESNVEAFETLFHSYIHSKIGGPTWGSKLRFDSGNFRRKDIEREEILALICRDKSGESLLSSGPDDAAEKAFFPFAFDVPLPSPQPQSPALIEMIKTGKYMPIPPPDARVRLKVELVLDTTGSAIVVGSKSYGGVLEIPQTIINEGVDAIRKYAVAHLDILSTTKGATWAKIDSIQGFEINKEESVLRANSNTGCLTASEIHARFNSGVYTCQT